MYAGWEPRHEKLYKDGALIRHRIQRTPDGEWEDYEENAHLYTAPPQREWVGLTDEEIKQLWKDTPQLVGVYSYTDIAREVEAKLKEKNT